MAKRLHKYQNWYGIQMTLQDLDGHSRPLFSWLTRTDPADVARVESKTVIATSRREDTLPPTESGVECQLGNWMSIPDMEHALTTRFRASMKGKGGPYFILSVIR